MKDVEVVSWSGQALAYVVRAAAEPDATRFLTPQALNLQLGFVVYGHGGEVARHRHRPVTRTTRGTAEVVLVRKGRCELDLYSDAGERVATRELGPGDLALVLGGGHGYRMLEDTVLLEIKQGPYTGDGEKEAF
jgi:hypothetical protein